MKIVRTFPLTLVVIINSIECSSDTPDQSSLQSAIFRARSSSPARSPPPITVLGYPLRKLGYIRLIPRTNQSLLFEFRNYILEADKPIRWRAAGKKYSPVPTAEQIVLTASNGDIFAILSYSGLLHGLYRIDRSHSRIKVNMNSGAIDNLTTDEIRDCPVGNRHPIFPNSFIKASGNHDSLHHEKNTNRARNPDSPSSDRKQSPDQTSRQEPFFRGRSSSPPGRPPSDEVLGWTIKELGFVRLIPRTNQNQRFEFRRYIFPTDKQIRMRIDGKTHVFSSTREYIVLSTSSGDVFAIMDHSGTLRGIYSTHRLHSRVKINIISGAVSNLTPDELKNCPVGKSHPIFPASFIQGFDDYNTLKPEQNYDGDLNRGASVPDRQFVSERPPLQEPPLRARPTSPRGRPPAHEVLGYTLAKLGYIRLIPKANPNRLFEFRRYIIPSHMSIRFQSGHTYIPVPNKEHIVLSTSNGNVFAILEYTGVLRGIYATNRRKPRVKINMMSGVVENLTAIEMSECHVGENYPIFPRWFEEVLANEDSLQHVYH